MSAVVAFFGMPGGPELLIVLFVALLLFGKKLPEVARNMGKGLTEFKRGIRGVEEDVHGSTSYDPEPTAERPMADDDLANVTAPKFEPPAPGNEDETDAGGDDQPEGEAADDPDYVSYLDRDDSSGRGE